METSIEKKVISQDYILTDLSRLYEFGSLNVPEKMALKEGKNELTFFQLENSSNILANHMTSLGVGKQDKIVILAEKRIEVAVIAAASWKCGAVYVPVDSESPLDRVQYLVDLLQPKVIFCSDKWEATYSGSFNNVTKIIFEELASSYQQTASLDHEVVNDEKDTAYIIFTSGSTGTPKGVMISHRSLLDYFVNQNEIFYFNKGSNCFSISPFHFDVSLEDVFLPLSRGSGVYLYKGLPIATKILKILSTERATHAVMVSTILTLLTKLKDKIAVSDLSALGVLVTGAEICNIDVINFWKSTFPNLKVYNAYGPTETTIVSHCYEIKKADDQRETIYPIGKPLRNVTSLLIDDIGNPIVANYVKGELLIGGPQVMSGYLNMPEETQRVLVLKDGNIYYRTGDFCFKDENDDFHFVGRSDTEVKIYGRRINLAEIHKELMKLTEVGNVSAGVIDRDENKHIITTLVVDKETSIDKVMEKIDEQLNKSLPKYMVPSFIGISKENHLSSTGKNDARKLNQLLETSIKSDNQLHRYYELKDEIFVGIK